MKISKHIPLGILLIWLNIPWTAALSQPPAPGEHDREAHQADSRSFLRSREWLGSGKIMIKALLRLKLWEQQDEWISYGTRFHIRHPDFQLQPLRLEIDPQIYATTPGKIPGYDFRESTAYRMDYAGGFVIPEHSKRENVLRVSPFTFFPFVYEAMKKLRAAVIQPSKKPSTIEEKNFAPTPDQGGSKD